MIERNRAQGELVWVSEELAWQIGYEIAIYNWPEIEDAIWRIERHFCVRFLKNRCIETLKFDQVLGTSDSQVFSLDVIIMRAVWLWKESWTLDNRFLILKYCYWNSVHLSITMPF